jgi:transposase InsO family protein
MLSKLAYLTLCRSVQLLALLARGDAAKNLEILVLRHQLSVLCRRTPRPKLEPGDRALLAAVSRLLPRSRWSCFFAEPDTLLRWHRRLVAGAWTYPHRQTGRPLLNRDIQQLIVRLANQNPQWATSASKVSSSQGNAYAERRVRTVRAECLDWLPTVGRGHLEQVLRVYVQHYNAHRPHRALGLQPPDPPARLTILSKDDQGAVRRHDLLGGLLHEYRRAA